jgi:hypothetical protein
MQTRYMRTEIATASVLAVLLLATSCGGVVSLHPMVQASDQDSVRDEALIGQWREVKSNATTPAIYTVERDQSGYLVSINDPEFKGKWPMQGVRVGDRYILDVLCVSEGPSPPVHTFVGARFAQDSVWVAEMQSNWLKEQIRKSAKLRFEVPEIHVDNLVLTDSHANLRRYLLPFASDARAFSEETELRRIK